MSKHKPKPEVDTSPNCVAVQYPSLPRKILKGTDIKLAIQQYRKDFKLSHLRPDNMFTAELVYEMERVAR